MSLFAAFEREAITILLHERLPSEIVSEVLEAGRFVSLEHTGAGYYLTVSHPELPLGRTVCDHPTLVGRAGGLEYGFVVFLENGELTFECHAWTDAGIPEDFRARQVTIETPP